MELTPVLSLIKPATLDTFDVSTLNTNMDRVDSGSVANSNSLNKVRLEVQSFANPWPVDTENVSTLGAYTQDVQVKYMKVGSVVYGTIIVDTNPSTIVNNYYVNLFVPMSAKYTPIFWIQYPNAWVDSETVGSCIAVSDTGNIIAGNVCIFPPGTQAVSYTPKGVFAFRMNWAYYYDKQYRWPSAPTAVAAIGATMPNMPNVKITGSFKYRVK